MPEGIRGFQVLSTVVHRNPRNQVALSTHLGIDRTILTYLLGSLVEAELVERVLTVGRARSSPLTRDRKPPPTMRSE